MRALVTGATGYVGGRLAEALLHVVKDASAAERFDVHPIGIDEALRRALAEEDGARAAAVP